MLTIHLNGEPTEIEQATSVDQLISKLGLENKRLAVEINMQIIPRSEFEQTTLQQDDKVEIVQAIGGGQAD